MDSSVTNQAVHESEGQRQYPRIRVAAALQFVSGGVARRYSLHDLSAGGLSFAATDSFPLQSLIRGASIAFRMEGVSFSLNVDFKIVNHDRQAGRYGCRFENLETHQIAALRHLITSHLTGEVVSVGNMLSIMSRDNFIGPRKKAGESGLSAIARLRALAITGLVLVAGLGAFAYASTHVYDLLFVTHSAAAKIAVPSVLITMPRDGTFHSLIPDNGLVKKGAPIAAYESAMLDVMQNDPGALKLSPDQLAQLLGQELRGSLSSPCDCRVHKQFAMDEQYVNRLMPVLELIPEKPKPYVLGRFHYEQIDGLPPGRRVSFVISGESSSRVGRIKEVRTLPVMAPDVGGQNDLRGLNNSSTTTDVIVEIEPAEPIAAELIERPVDVRVNALDRFF